MKILRKKALLGALIAGLAWSAPPSVTAMPRSKAAQKKKAERKRAKEKKRQAKRAARNEKSSQRGIGKKISPPKVRTAAQVAGQIRPGQHVFLPIGHTVPGSVISALVARANKPSALSGDNPVKVVSLSNVASRKLFETDKIVPRAVFIGGNNRDAIAEGKGDFVPTHLSRIPGLIKEGNIKVDVAIIQVSPPDKNGNVTLGPTAAAARAAIDAAKTVIAEVNPNVPRTFGKSVVPLSKIDYIVHSDKPLREVAPARITGTDRKIAKNVAALIPENPTLQFGIGGTTDAVAGLLADSGRKDLRIHTEMMSDGTMRLAKSGAIKDKIVYSFAMGSKKMLDWIDGNKKLRSETSDIVNDPIRLAQIERLVSINTALRVDLNGDVNAQFIGSRFYSGVGGQQDFFRGAMMSPGGKAILALPSTSMVKGKLTSRIVLKLGEGDITTTSMHDIQYVVTEYGTAHLEGKSIAERAEALIEVAHPKLRKELRKEYDQQMAQRRDAVVQKRAARQAKAREGERR